MNSVGFLCRFIVIASALSSSTCKLEPFSKQSSDISKLFDRLPISPDSYLHPTEIIARHGYPFENHTVTTDDGYILELHRIPYSSQSPNTQRKAVLLQHGITHSSSAFLSSPTTSLAYLLADTGYDVWLANSRGTRYARRHVKLDPSQDEFWNFSYEEMGTQDFPAVVKYVLNATKQEKLAVVCHSLGGTIVFIGLTQHPELNAQIDVVVALAPSFSLANVPNYYQYFFRYYDLAKFYWRFTRTRIVFNNEGNERRQQQLLCEQFYWQAAICREIIFLTFGRYPGNLDLTFVPIFNGQWPSGTSIKLGSHMSQNFLSGGKYQAFDYGPAENLRRYGTETPAEFDLKKVTAPVYIFWTENDMAVSPKDVAQLAQRLGNIKGLYRVEDAKFTHLCFLYGNNAKEMVYDRILPLLPSPMV